MTVLPSPRLRHLGFQAVVGGGEATALTCDFGNQVANSWLKKIGHLGRFSQASVPTGVAQSFDSDGQVRALAI